MPSMFGSDCIPDHELVKDFAFTAHYYYEYHSQIGLSDAAAAAVDAALREGNLPAAVAIVKREGHIGSNRNPCEEVLDALYQVPPNQDETGVPMVRIVSEFYNDARSPRYWFEIRLKMELDEQVLDSLRNDLAAGDLANLRKALLSARVSRPNEFAKLVAALYVDRNFTPVATKAKRSAKKAAKKTARKVAKKTPRKPGVKRRR